MSTIHFKKTTTATAEQFIAGLTDYGPGRGKIFGNSTDEYLKVHKKGTNYADVTSRLRRATSCATKAKHTGASWTKQASRLRRN